VSSVRTAHDVLQSVRRPDLAKVGAFLRILFIAAIPCGCASPVPAQETQQPRFSIVLSAGIRPSGPWTADIRAAMIRSNLDGDRCGNTGEVFCNIGAGVHPDEDALSFGITTTYRFRPSVELALTYASVNAGSVDGYFDGGNSGTFDSDAELWVDMHAWTVAASARYRAGMVWLGGGPTLRLQRTSVTTASDRGRGGRTDRRTTFAPAFVLATGLIWPQHSSFFLDLSAHYNWASAQTFGPYQVLNEQGQARATMTATRASFAYAVAGLGVGIRF
jgi:hypothetical protein